MIIRSRFSVFVRLWGIACLLVFINTADCLALDKAQYNTLAKLEKQLVASQNQVKKLDDTINKSRGVRWPAVKAKLRSSSEKKAALMKKIGEIKKEIQKNGGLEQLYSSQEYKNSMLRKLNGKLKSLERRLESLEKRETEAKKSKDRDINKVLMFMRKDKAELKKQIREVQTEIRKYGGIPI